MNPRNPYLLGLVGVVAAVLLVALVAGLAPQDWGASTPGPAAPGVEVDVDVHRRAPVKAQRSAAPRHSTGTTRLSKTPGRR